MTVSPEEPLALAYSTANCQVERAMAVLGERYSMVVLREVFVGVRRFDEIHRHSGVSRQVLSNRLALLVAEGILTKVTYQATGSRPRHEYRLTAKGLDLYPVLTALAQWGARYYSDPEGPAVQMVHRDCESPVDVGLSCAAGHDHLSVLDIAPRPGSGARLLD
ncbi:helix-turn-helix domain-containing protein [Modestobacter sp. VKM Ac-2979]|uniref:winged helix-turn-helix transcriptional regulator n=1 Tax=unclassified Modestobacter TaxID=2643866 RepID=UPI0022ABB796|nr:MULTISPECIES: helix-turn-helix domain-containing protein [unclassified Modestobacter]MCZ2813979.1 helix-turn-helix domain-containing protein [Modestobacter sp. VKM Ac-2979]MCZ2844605.1 helix-turn-helix domain-containing protein [Modestobacter sp. VKM Ac-2980]